MHPQVVEKYLSANDTGATGGHQAGILIPKAGSVLLFFPPLEATVKNPRAVFNVTDDAGGQWPLVFIHYNNRFFGGTRNEYRLTGMTRFFRAFNLHAGDKIILKHVSPELTRILYERPIKSGQVLKLSDSWVVVDGQF